MQGFIAFDYEQKPILLFSFRLRKMVVSERGVCETSLTLYMSFFAGSCESEKSFETDAVYVKSVAS